MPQIINTNIASLNAQRNLDNSQKSNDVALQRLSSGLRINSAKDDAAGLAISTRFDTQIRGTSVAIRNAGDGVSLSQLAEGSLGSMETSLQRIRELALQSANGTNGDLERQALNDEAQQLIEEITRTAETTNFNGTKLLDGSFTSQFQVGANSGETIDVAISDVSASTLGAGTGGGLSAVSSANAMAVGDLVLNGIAISGSSASDDTASTSNAEASSIAKAAAINSFSDQTGVTATVDTNVASGAEMTASALNGSITLNGISINVETTDDAATTRAAVVTAINAVQDQTGVTAIDTGEDGTGVNLEAADGRNITIAFTTVTSEASGLAAAGTYEGTYTLSGDSDTKEIVISGGNGTGNGDVANAGLVAGTYATGSATVLSEQQDAATTHQTIGGTGSLGNLVDVAANVVTTEDVAVSINVGGTVTQQTLAAGQSIGDLAGDIDAVAGIDAYELFSESITGTTLVAGDTIDFGTTIVTATGGTLETLTDDINGTDFSADNLEVSAVLNTAGTAMQLTVRNYDGSTQTALTFSAGVITGADNGAYATLDVLSGELAFRATDGTTDVSVTLSQPTGENELTAAAASETSEYTGVGGLESGDLVINGVNIGAADESADTASAEFSSVNDRIVSSDKSLSGIAVAASINAASADTGVTATVNATSVVGGDGTANTAAIIDTGAGPFAAGDLAGIYINGVNLGTVSLQVDGTDIDVAQARTDAVSLINNGSAQTGVSAEDNGVSITLTAVDGRNVSVAIDNQAGTSDSIGSLMGLDSAVAGIGEGSFGSNANTVPADTLVEALTYETTYSSVSLTSAGEIVVEGGENGNDDAEAIGFSVGTFGGAATGQFLNEIDISTVEGANLAVTAIDNALNSISSERASLGAVQNRFESTISSLQVSSENLSAANSRIRDADFAAETAALARSQVLMQAGISVLSQANARPQQVLSLLQ